MQQQDEALDMQRQTAMLAMQEQRAKVALLNAQAEKVMADIQGAGQGGINPKLEGQVRQIQTQAAAQIDQLSTDLRKTQSELANRTLQIKQDSDTKLEVAH